MYEALSIAPIGLSNEFVRLETLLREAIDLEKAEVLKLEHPRDVELGDAFVLGMTLALDTVMNEMGLASDLGDLSSSIWDILVESDADAGFYITEQAIAIYDGKREIFELASSNSFSV